MRGQIIYGLPQEGELLISLGDQPITIGPSRDEYFYIATQYPLILELTSRPTLGYPSYNPGGNMGVVTAADSQAAQALMQDAGSCDVPLRLDNPNQAIRLPSMSNPQIAAPGQRFIVSPHRINGVAIYAKAPCPKLVVTSCGELRVDPAVLWREGRVRFEDDRMS